jgi:predicted MFS family arabinose efflux permease
MADEQLGPTLAVASAGTVVALVAYTTPVATLAGTAAALDAGVGGQAWILSSMSLGLAVALLPSGAIGDGFGRRRVFIAGSLVLAAFSVLAALAPTTGTLVAARIGQGVGAAAVISCGLGLIGHAFAAGPARARATGIWGACLGAGIAVGPPAAAALEPVAGWPGAYWLLAGLAAALAVAARRWLAESRAAERRAADPIGMVLLGTAMAALLSGLVLLRTDGLRPVPLGLLAGGLGLAAVFLVVELRRRHPMLDPRLLRRPDFAGASLAGLVTGTGVIAAMSFLPTLVQRGMGHGAMYAALLLFAWSGTSVVTALLARRLPVRVSAQAQLGAGLLGVAVGQVLLGGLSATSGAAEMLPGLLVAGAASGVLNAALAREAVASMPPGQASVGSGANNTARYLGAAVGVTVVAVLAVHPEPAAMFAGWNHAIAVTAGSSVLGGLVVLGRLVLARRSSVGEAAARSVESPHVAHSARPLN